MGQVRSLTTPHRRHAARWSPGRLGTTGSGGDPPQGWQVDAQGVALAASQAADEGAGFRQSYLPCAVVASNEPGNNEPFFEIQVPPELETGAYSNFLAVWHSPHDFTLDFAITGQALQAEDGSVTVPCRVVARIKIPLTVAEAMLQALATNVSKYEDVAGRIRKPGEDVPPGESRGGSA